VRSCITFAVACDGASVTTVEGYDDDPIMQRLRPAFSRHHALQCGFCTPGMLATARDIVLRLPDADEHRVRVELSGNLCRCTGYMGIVAAVMSVLEELRDEAPPEIEALRNAVREGRAVVPAPAKAEAFVGFAVASPQGSPAAAAAVPAAAAPQAKAAGTAAPAEAAASASPAEGAGKPAGGTRIEGRFDVPVAADRVWEFMGDLPAVAACLPGATVTSMDGDKVRGKVAVKFGPMSAAFNGAARLERDDAARSAVLRGAGQDTLSQSRANGDIGYRLEVLSPDSTRVHIDMRYSLQGPLAQFSRSGLVRDFVGRMIAEFGRNVTARLQGPANGGGAPVAAAGINPVRMLLSVAWARIKGLFGAPR
jgi:carbon-monoxide dehydrogenase small subunit